MKGAKFSPEENIICAIVSVSVNITNQEGTFYLTFIIHEMRPKEFAKVINKYILVLFAPLGKVKLYNI